MNPEQAAQAAEDVKAKAMTPEHVGRFTLASHDWNEPFKRITVNSEGRSYALWTPLIVQMIQFNGSAQSFDRWRDTID